MCRHPWGVYRGVYIPGVAATLRGMTEIPQAPADADDVVGPEGYDADLDDPEDDTTGYEGPEDDTVGVEDFDE